MAIKLSLICPVYKVVEYIPDLMNSLLAGVNSEQVEVIFVDDGCPQQSIDVCEQFIAEHQGAIKFQFKIIKQAKNQGQAAARNVALNTAIGMYIGFIDSDDAISPFYWETLATYVVKAKHDIIEFGFTEFTDSLPKLDNVDVAELPSSQLNPFYYDFFVWTRLYKKAVIKDIFFPEGMIYEDIFYNTHAFAKAKSTVRLSSCLVYYRKREGSTTALRTSQYSQLLINLVTATEQTISKVHQQRQLVSLLQKRCLLAMLKGLKIADNSDRKIYYQLCLPSLLSVKKLANVYGSAFKSKIHYFVACLICRVLK
jgi:glycosyltransferase involved in cell wall biosynthesis